ncbi:Spherulation-specific family 4, partial [Phaeosphaeria sp. MPI-PUGE-AT-0046c]
MAESVIVPLYVYPSMGAWDPIFNMASSYPQVHFTAIVNVHNGPGDGALPNPEYAYAIETLNSFDNIRTVGYVATTWCTRDLTSVLDDIAAYSFWGEYRDSLAIDGIFVDETPTQYSLEAVTYLETIAQTIHESDGLKEGYIGRVTF